MEVACHGGGLRNEFMAREVFETKQRQALLEEVLLLATVMEGAKGLPLWSEVLLLAKMCGTAVWIPALWAIR